MAVILIVTYIIYAPSIVLLVVSRRTVIDVDQGCNRTKLTYSNLAI